MICLFFLRDTDASMSHNSLVGIYSHAGKDTNGTQVWSIPKKFSRNISSHISEVANSQAKRKAISHQLPLLRNPI